MAGIVRGLEATVGQTHQSLHNLDLVREALAGDPDGKVKRASETVNLDKVLDSGPAPMVEITSNPADSTSASRLAAVTARITNRGKAIGRVGWRVNDVTVRATQTPPGAGPDYEVHEELAPILAIMLSRLPPIMRQCSCVAPGANRDRLRRYCRCGKAMTGARYHGDGNGGGVKRTG